MGSKLNITGIQENIWNKNWSYKTKRLNWNFEVYKYNVCQNIKKLWYLDEFFLFTLADRDLQGWPIDIPNTGTLISKQCEINSSEIWLSELREDWTSLCAWPGVMIQSSGTSNSKSKGPRCSPVLNTCIYLQISINWKIGLVHLHSMGIRNLIPHNWEYPCILFIQ